MAVFFLLIGLEIKREFLEGELSSRKKASLPVFAALGGALTPALIFWLINRGTDAAAGGGIPMATDIAFALAALSLLGKRIPVSLKIFLAALAIADDLIAILVIAIFYSSELHISNLFFSAALFLLMIVFNRLGYRSLFFYLIPGLLIWYLIHHSGIHATIAGVITAWAVPTNRSAQESPLEQLERYLGKPVNFLIMPLFALANTNIYLGHASFEMLTGGLGAGILLGLMVGKPLGIALFSWLLVKSGRGVLPSQSHWGHIIGVGLLGGIGFTMSIFVSLLSFDDTDLQNSSKISILAASICSGVIGCLFLSLFSARRSSSLKIQ